jgi:hypothetical protein
LATELEDEGLDEGPDDGTDGYDWAIEEIREITNKLSQYENPARKSNGPRHSLRTFNLLNSLIDLIPTDESENVPI